MKMQIYADNAATTKLDIDAYNAMQPFMLEDYGNASQPYSFAKSAKQALHYARSAVAECINADPDEIFFTSGGTESDNWAIKAMALNDPKRRAMITSQIEHHALLHSCSAMEEIGYPVVYLPVDTEGIIQETTLRGYITRDTHLVSVMLANNEIGTIEPIQRICAVAHEFGAFFHTDAVQAVGHVHVDVRDLGVDMLSASAHKFNGPKGIGFLYIRNGTPLISYLDGGAQEAGRRAGTENIAAAVGMAVALKKNCCSIDATSAHLKELEDALLTHLRGAGVDFVLNGSRNRLPGNMSLSFRNENGERLLHRLDLMGICVSTGSACDSRNTQISHVLRAIRLPDEFAKGTIRVSLGKDNCVEEAIAIADGIVKILGK